MQKKSTNFTDLTIEERRKIGDKIRALRKAMGLTQGKFAEEVLNISESHLRSLEQGRASVSPQMMEAVCVRMGVLPEYLLNDEDPGVSEPPEGPPGNGGDDELHDHSEQVRRMREALNLTVEDCAQMIGVNARTLRNVEAAQQRLGRAAMQALYRLPEVLGTLRNDEVGRLCVAEAVGMAYDYMTDKEARDSLAILSRKGGMDERDVLQQIVAEQIKKRTINEY